jgi:hypothetical protein
MTSANTSPGDRTAVATSLVSQFDRVVRRDGGAVVLVGVDDDVIRVGYRPGADASCDTDACVLPHLELQQLMAETLARRDASLRVVVELSE